MLAEIDRLSITLLMDNYTDRLLPPSYPAVRPPMIKDEQFLHPPVAEHGFSALIRATCYGEGEGDGDKSKTGKESTVLFDCGTSENGVVHNADILGIDLNSIDSIILSHGHFDHFTGLPKILERIGKPIKMVCHPDAFLRRWLVFPNGNGKARMPFLDKYELQRQGAIITAKKGPSIVSESNVEEYQHKDPLSNSTNTPTPNLLVTGQIPRHTAYEKGFPLQYKEDSKNSNLIHDPLVNDDQAIVANIGKRGLVVISGCAHAGIINTINYAKRLTGINKIFSIVGGFHLTGGGIYEEAIEPTIAELKNMDPGYLVPCHCTGWKATSRIIQEMAEKFLQPTTCTTFTFDSNP